MADSSRQNVIKKDVRKDIFFFGVARLEPATSASRTQRATTALHPDNAVIIAESRNLCKRFANFFYPFE